VFNTTNTQTWCKTHLNTGLLHMFSASDCQTQAAVWVRRSVWTSDKQGQG